MLLMVGVGLIIVGINIYGCLRRIVQELDGLRSEQHQGQTVHVIEVGVIAGKLAQIAAELKNEVSLNLERSVDSAELRKERTKLYQLEVARMGMLIESTRCGVTIRDTSDPPITLEYIRDMAGMKVAMDVAEAMKRATEPACRQAGETETTPKDGDQT